MAKALVPTDEENLGPAMLACNPKQRAFIAHWFECKSGAQAAREAGYGNPDGTTTALSFTQIAQRLLHNERVQAAMVEYTRKTIRTLGPAAVQAQKDILTTSSHKDRAKISISVLDRIDPPVTKIDAHHTHEVIDRTKVAVEHLTRLKAKGANREFLIAEFGELGLAHFEAILAKQEQPIDAEFRELPPPDDDIPRIEDL